MKPCFFFAILVVFWGCNTKSGNQQKECQKNEFQNPPPPPLPVDQQKKCDSLKFITYAELRKGEITFAFNDTIRNNNEQYLIYISILKTKFGFNYYRLYDIGFQTVEYKQCVQPIMDSAIIAMYGIHAKDSIINIAYRMANTAYIRSKK